MLELHERRRGYLMRLGDRSKFRTLLNKFENSKSFPGMLLVPVLSFFIITLSFTAGTAFIMWLGESITEKGIGNGFS